MKKSKVNTIEQSERAKKNWNTAKFVMKHVTTSTGMQIRLFSKYWHEKKDPLHRPKDYLEKKFDEWINSTTTLKFYEWLDQQQSKDTTMPGSIRYLSLEESIELYSVEFRNGQCYQKNALLDTTEYKGKEPGRGAYIITPDGQMLMAPHIVGIFQHSSFIKGGKVGCAGMVTIKNGKIAFISNCSGHYHYEGVKHVRFFAATLNFIPESTLDENIIIYYRRHWDKLIFLDRKPNHEQLKQYESSYFLVKTNDDFLLYHLDEKNDLIQLNTIQLKNFTLIMQKLSHVDTNRLLHDEALQLIVTRALNKDLRDLQILQAEADCADYIFNSKNKFLDYAATKGVGSLVRSIRKK